MSCWDVTRPGELEGPAPVHHDASLVFIGRIRTPFASRNECPRQGTADGPECRIELDEPWRPTLAGLDAYECVEVLYWMHLARRDLLLQTPKTDGKTHGTFALRSPVRPNPIATSRVSLVSLESWGLIVRGLDCVDGTPLLDLKPVRTELKPLAPPLPSNKHG